MCPSLAFKHLKYGSREKLLYVRIVASFLEFCFNFSLMRMEVDTICVRFDLRFTLILNIVGKIRDI